MTDLFHALALQCDDVAIHGIVDAGSEMRTLDPYYMAVIQDENCAGLYDQKPFGSPGGYHKNRGELNCTG